MEAFVARRQTRVNPRCTLTGIYLTHESGPLRQLIPQLAYCHEYSRGYLLFINIDSMVQTDLSQQAISRYIYVLYVLSTGSSEIRTRLERMYPTVAIPTKETCLILTYRRKRPDSRRSYFLDWRAKHALPFAPPTVSPINRYSNVQQWS